MTAAVLASAAPARAAGPPGHGDDVQRGGRLHRRRAAADVRDLRRRPHLRHRAGSGSLDVSVSGGPYGESYGLEFDAPDGQALTPGVYTGAQRAPFHEAGRPGHRGLRRRPRLQRDRRQLRGPRPHLRRHRRRAERLGALRAALRGRRPRAVRRGADRRAGPVRRAHGRALARAGPRRRRPGRAGRGSRRRRPSRAWPWSATRRATSPCAWTTAPARATRATCGCASCPRPPGCARRRCGSPTRPARRRTSRCRASPTAAPPA